MLPSYTSFASGPSCFHGSIRLKLLGGNAQLLLRWNHWRHNGVRRDDSGIVCAEPQVIKLFSISFHGFSCCFHGKCPSISPASSFFGWSRFLSCLDRADWLTPTTYFSFWFHMHFTCRGTWMNLTWWWLSSAITSRNLFPQTAVTGFPLRPRRPLFLPGLAMECFKVADMPPASTRSSNQSISKPIM